MTCASFTGGAGGMLRADGGAGYIGPNRDSGGGGGGRIAIGIGFSEADRARLIAGATVTGLFIYQQDALFTGTLSVTNGAGWKDLPDTNGAYPGTLQLMRVLTNAVYGLTIAGDPAQYDSPATNGYGTWMVTNGTVFTNAVSSPVGETNGMRWACYGWRAETNEGGTNVGGLIASGASTQAVFTVHTNSILTWLWTNQYQLAVRALTNGTVNSNSVNGFYTNGAAAAGITAEADPAYYFQAWIGNVPDGYATDNPLTVTMDQARTNITAIFGLAAGGPKTWNGAGNWTSITNWTPSGMPGSNDDVLLQSGTVTISQAHSIGALVVSNGATLVFSNWNSCLAAARDVTVLSNGVITLPPAFTTNQMSNNIYLVCANFTLDSGGAVLADNCGYKGANGPGRGGSTLNQYRGAGGGGHGGKGGAGGAATMADANVKAGGATYDAANAPLVPGSGGGKGYDNAGGAGGGAVRIEATGILTINGTVTANGGDGDGDAVWGASGGGSGGAIYLACGSFGGSTNGILRANGGNVTGVYSPGSGGGGRIAVNYVSLAGTPGVRCSANCGAGVNPTIDVNAPVDCPAPQMGTLSFTNAALLESVITAWAGAGLNGYVFFQATNVWAPHSLALSNSTLGIPEGCRWQIANDLTVQTGRVVVAAHATLACGGQLILTNGASLVAYAGETNAVYPNPYGCLVGVTNTLTVAPNCWIYPFAHSTNGGAVLFRVGGLTLLGGGGIDADGRGYGRTNGPGHGFGIGGQYNAAGGGGYGGKGGLSYIGQAGGVAYGSTNLPLAPGSGGGTESTYGGYGGHGGGLVWIESPGSVRVDGTVSVNGAIGTNSTWGGGGGGSGGAIYIQCWTFGGHGVLRADGGRGGNYGIDYPAGGGGGGRIAVWVGVPQPMQTRYLDGEPVRAVVRSITWPQLGTMSVANGLGYVNVPTNCAYPGAGFFFKYARGTVFSAGK